MSSSPDTDIAIVGGGLSGTVAAVVLGQRGHRVTLIDRSESFPPEFRVEKISGGQIAHFERLGLLPALAGSARYFDSITNARHGRLLDTSPVPHYGIMYHELVAAMRRQLPPSVRFVAGRVADLRTSSGQQTLTLTDHGDLTARLVVLASGMSDLLRARLGIERQVRHERQSLTFGFNAKVEKFPSGALTYYGERPSDGIDYLSFFAVGDTTRANLFTFLDHRHPWVKQMRTEPDAALAAALPGLSRIAGDIEVVGKVQSWIMDLAVARNVEQPGVVLIGDAYQTSCPAAGTGVSRLMTDVERLSLLHIPAWLASPGMDADKIAAFYRDPIKRAMDAHAFGMADFRRGFTVGVSLPWRARRETQFLRRRAMYRMDRISPSLAAGLRRLRA
jgi:2-polyprenyl-6-methoxyphenol hydroxylase-like FAD-dependent oxidoreductase